MCNCKDKPDCGKCWFCLKKCSCENCGYCTGVGGPCEVKEDLFPNIRKLFKHNGGPGFEPLENDHR